MAASARLFKNGWVDVDATGLDFSKPSHLSGLQDLTLSSEVGNSELTEKIQQVLVKMQKNKETNENMHVELDAYWVALFLHVTHSPLLQTISWRFFVLPPEHIFDIKHVIDIGPYVRKLSVNRAISSDVMCRIIQYSLPYVKHNRLNFPRYKDMPMHVLVGLLQMVLALLLGLCSKSSKKPLWQMRFGILIYMHSLMSKGSQYDLYVFCMHNVNLVRIAVIEYFVYFVQNNMPCEFETLNLMFGTHCNVHVVFRQFCTNIDLFRVHCLQNEHLLWQDLNTKAHYVIEKCNRLCKSKPKINISNLSSSNKTKFEFSSKILHLPRFQHMLYCKMLYPELSTTELKQVCFLHNNFYFTRLPSVILRLQSKAVLNALMYDSNMYKECMILHVCFRCLLQEKQISVNMRVNELGDVFCSTCQQQDNVFRVNILGSILRVFKNLYYLCPVCLKVHLWHGTGSEFFVCPVQDNKIHKNRMQCVLCMRNVGVTVHKILDTTLGVMQELHLCQRHSPREFDVPWNHNLQALAQCVKRKMSFRGFRT